MNPFRSGVSASHAPYIGGVTEFFVFHLGNARRLWGLDSKSLRYSKSGRRRDQPIDWPKYLQPKGDANRR